MGESKTSEKATSLFVKALWWHLQGNPAGRAMMGKAAKMAQGTGSPEGEIPEPLTDEQVCRALRELSPVWPEKSASKKAA